MLPVVPAAGDFNFPYTAFLARAGLWNNPDFQENGVPASSQRGEQRKSPSKVLSREAVRTFWPCEVSSR